MKIRSAFNFSLLRTPYGDPFVTLENQSKIWG